MLSQFDDVSNVKDMYKVVPSAKQALMWCFMVWEEMDAQIIQNCWRASGILPPHWNADFKMKDESEKRRMVREADELSALIAQSKLGGEVQDYVNMAGEDCVEAEYNTNELVHIALDNGLRHLMILTSTLI